MECKRNEIYTIKEAARILKWTPWTIRQKIGNGQLPAKKFGGEWRILGSELLKCFKERKEALK